MGNCNTRLLFGGTNTNARNMAAAAPASDNAYPQGASLMRSTSSDESTYILFENQTESRVKLYWLNYDGQEVAYRSIEPGRVHRQQTFMTHPWTFKLLDPGTEKRETDVVVDDRRVVFPNDDSGPRKAVLRKPSLWEWSPDNHKKHFPKKVFGVHRGLPARAPHPEEDEERGAHRGGLGRQAPGELGRAAHRAHPEDHRAVGARDAYRFAARPGLPEVRRRVRARPNDINIEEIENYGELLGKDFLPPLRDTTEIRNLFFLLKP
mmetsp:Transcript_1641/g.5594  ORF Transcript_1641/g.5594 Transcript_1641/m.5594 type:complete len:264 (-) Transcript_1641:2480-3271(-)